MTLPQRGASGEDADRLVRGVERAVAFEPPTAGDRDDLVQETLLRLWKRLAVRRETDPPSELIRTVVRRIRIDWWRRRREIEGVSGDEIPGREPSPLDDAEWNELRGLVRSAIDGLPEPQREVVRLVFYEKRTFKEVACLQGVPLNTALGRMHLAMRRLRRTLERHHDGMPGR
ncbi:MAG TPA: sigma-70 family RNA polymerase sigma factor [Planctomycetota bacterium]|jgi:RNA polymerase sigma-70 factor (ECF subfamily)|nr:sigma-70 family RNA polymerase sigma factor [Planctomycetota bacterium]